MGIVHQRFGVDGFCVAPFWFRRIYKPVLRTREGHAVVIATVLVSFYLGIHAINHLPFIDFRAYKVGNNIPAQMKPTEQPIIEYIFTKDGKEIKSTQYLAQAGYQYVSSRVVNEDRIKPKITDYAVSTPTGEDKTPYTFEGNRLLIVISDVKKSSIKNIAAIRELTKQLESKVDCFILTASTAEAMETFRHENQLAIPYFYADATVLKTIIRSNPGIALWKNGTVLGNWHHNDAPTPAEVLDLVSKK